MSTCAWNRRLGLLGCVVVVLSISCAPAAAPTATSAPTKPAAVTAPTKPAEVKPAVKVEASPVATAETKPAESPAAKPEAKTPPKPAAKAAFDEKVVADFYRGKTVRIVVGFAAGGGFDIISRLISRHIGRSIPGTPNVIVENTPGAASMLALNQVYNVAPKDGTVIANASSGAVLQQILGASAVQFDVNKMHLLGTDTPTRLMMVVTKAAGVTKLEETLGPNAKEVIIGANPPGTASTDAAILTRDVLGVKMKLISSYDGLAKVRLAMEQGEVQGFFNSWESIRLTDKDKVDGGGWIPIAHFADAPMSEFPRLPSALDFAKTEEDRQIIRVGVIGPNQILHLFALAPEVPADRVAALNEAFTKTMQDKEFLEEAKRNNLDINAKTGAEVKRIVQEMGGMPVALRDRLKKLLSPSNP